MDDKEAYSKKGSTVGAQRKAEVQPTEDMRPRNLSAAQREHLRTLDADDISVWWGKHCGEFHPETPQSYSMQQTIL